MNKQKFILLPIFCLILAGGIFVTLRNSGYFSRPMAKPAVSAFPGHKASAPRPKQSIPDQAVTSFRLRISGSPQFEEKVKEAVYLIWKHDPEAFRFIKKYVYLIRRSNKTDFSVENGVPTVLLTDKTALKSPTWCAGAIAHQAFLAYFHYEKKRRSQTVRPPPLPGELSNLEVAHNPMAIEYTDFKSLYAMERRADSFQIKVMKRIGAPRSETRLIKNRKKDDFSLIHDGK